MSRKYTIGLDYGTTSGRALLVACDNGEEIAVSVMEYKNAVMDKTLPDGKTPLGVNWALQNPMDYIEVLAFTVRDVMEKSGVSKDDIIGVSIDFTCCTVLPVDKNKIPMCEHDKYRSRPHAYAKLWKHHAGQKQADYINRYLKEKELIDLPRFGGGVGISSELLLPKVLQIVDEDYEIYKEMDQFLEAGDWLAQLLTDTKRRSANMAGYKAMWHPEEGYPSKSFFRDIDPRIENIVDEKLGRDICQPGEKMGGMCQVWAERLGLNAGTAVAASIIDAHAGLPGSGITKPGQMMLVIGTSTVQLVLGDKCYSGKGVCGAIKGAIIPGYYSLESGLAAVGDMFSWFTKNGVPASYESEAAAKGMNIHQYLAFKASQLKPGQSGLLAIDWWNGNKTPFVNGDLSGVIFGYTLLTKPEEIYRALIEATAYGTNLILEICEESGTPVDEIIASGGITNKNPMLMQIYADVTNREIKLSASDQTGALGSAMYAAVAAGKSCGGYGTMFEAAAAMGRLKETAYTPIPENVAVYKELYAEYKKMVELLGPDNCDTVKKLKTLREKCK